MVTVPQQPLPSGLITASPTGPAPVYFEGSVGVPDMPAWVKQIPNGAVLQGTVQGRTSNNTYSVLTAQGPITITSALALQTGTQLLFQIGPEVANQRLHLVGGTNPAPLPSSAQAPAGAVAAPPSPAAAGVVLNAIVIRPADSAPAPGSAAPAASPATPAPAAPGIPTQAALAAYAPSAAKVAVNADPASVAMTALSQPQPSAPTARPAPLLPQAGQGPAPAAPAPVPVPPSSGSGTAPPPTAPAGQAAASPPAPAAPTVLSVTQPGETISVRVVAILPPTTADTPETGRQAPPPPAADATPAAAARSGAPPAGTTPLPSAPSPLGLLRDGLASLLALARDETAPTGTGGPKTAAPATNAPLLTGPLLTGTVIGNGVQNRPILTVGTAVLSLEAAPLPPGTQVQLVPQLTASATAPAAPSLANAPAVQSAIQGFPTYPSLPALVAAAQQAGGDTERAVLAMLPRLGPQLAASLMVFASGAAKGDLRTLVGDSARASLEKTGRGRSALAGALQEFEAAGEEARSGSSAEWRGITLPVMSGGASIEPIRLYLHQVSDEEAERNRKNEGGGQRFLLDIDLTRIGSIQVDGLAKQNQLDLVIRTPDPLPQPLRDGIRTVFLESAVARGVAGTVSFQVAPKLVPDTGQPVRRQGGLMV